MHRECCDIIILIEASNIVFDRSLAVGTKQGYKLYTFNNPEQLELANDYRKIDLFNIVFLIFILTKVGKKYALLSDFSLQVLWLL